MGSTEQVDVVVVGAGFAGLAAAKGYVQCAPDTNLVILDSNESLGGVWAKENIYEELRSNNLLGTFEFPDFPFGERFGAKEGQHIPGLALHDYLHAFCKEYGLLDRLKLRSRVLDAEQLDAEKGGAWRISVQTPEGTYALTTSKLIVATGLTSEPQPMRVKGQDDFNAPLINVARLAREAPRILEDPGIKRITVFGGSKSAYDTVYTFASAGKEIDWVIRKTGHGPTWMSPSHVVLGPLGRFWAEHLTTRRILAWLSPCLWGDTDGMQWWRNILHHTWLGNKFVNLFWWKVGSDIVEQSGLNSDPQLAALIPDSSMMSTGTSFAILNYPKDIHDFIRSGQVRLHRQDLGHLSDHAVHLADGTHLPSDAFIASTGWLFGPAINFKDVFQHSDLGIPSTQYTEEQKTFWSKLDQRADAYIFSTFPQLKTEQYPPRANEDLLENPLDELDASEGLKTRQEYSPWRLYRSLIPPGLAAKGDRSLAFAGFSASVSGHIRNEIAGLWIYAWMNDKLTLDPCHEHQAGKLDIFWDTALFMRWCFRRYPFSFGRRFPDWVFDAVPFNDVMLKDLGLNGVRKGRKGDSWWKNFYREATEPYTMADYRGITAEWLAKGKKGGPLNGSVERKEL